MLEVNDKNDGARMLDSKCKIDLQESKKLLKFEKSRNLQMYIEFNDICYSIRNRNGTVKTILDNVTGHFAPGKVTVIIGTSGAGKTTLLKIISGKRSTDIKGTITVNGIEWNRGIFRKQMCYIQQQFHLLPLLTTRETLYIAARLKLDVNQSRQAINLVVNDIAESFNLSTCLDTLACKLSGGERRRLSIGVEMITKPSVLLLDEPTSGLDSVASNQLIDMLHDMATANCTVVCVIHQPSSQMISLFDNIMVLNQGRCMYCGPKSEILNTYSIAGFTCPSFYNIAEFVLEVITKQRDGDLENLQKICCEKYEQFRLHSKRNEDKSNSLTNSKQEFEMDNTPINRKIQEKSIWQQQKILFLRALICIKRDNILTKLKIATHIIIGLLFGIVYHNFGDDVNKVNSNISCLSQMTFFLLFVNCLHAIPTISTEAAVIIQEHLNNWYSLRSYYSVKIVTDLPMQILCTSSFFSISYYMTGQPMEYDRILQAWSTCLLFAILGQTIGICSGTAFGTEAGIFLTVVINIPLFILSGFYVKIREIVGYLQPLSLINYFRYAYIGIVQAVYLDRPNLSCLKVYCYLKSPKKILSIMDIPTTPFYVILIMLSCCIVFYHIITYMILCWKIHYARK